MAAPGKPDDSRTSANRDIHYGPDNRAGRVDVRRPAGPRPPRRARLGPGWRHACRSGLRARPRTGDRAEVPEHRERALADLRDSRRRVVRLHGADLVSLVLAIEPDHRQATILKRIVREHVRADFVLVDSRD